VTIGRRRVLVRGSNNVASAVAHRLFSAGHAVVLFDGPAPAASRRRMAFADAVFAGRAVLAGVVAERVDAPELVPGLLATHGFIPVVVGNPADLLPVLVPEVLVDARMRKRDQPEPQRGLAPITVGLDPGFAAGGTVDIAVETSWDGLGGIVRHGALGRWRANPAPSPGTDGTAPSTRRWAACSGPSPRSARRLRRGRSSPGSKGWTASPPRRGAPRADPRRGSGLGRDQGHRGQSPRGCRRRSRDRGAASPHHRGGPAGRGGLGGW
jgi:hypothetical protein